MTEADGWLVIAQLGGIGALIAAAGFYMLHQRDRENAAAAAERSTPAAE